MFLGGGGVTAFILHPTIFEKMKKNESNPKKCRYNMNFFQEKVFTSSALVVSNTKTYILRTINKDIAQSASWAVSFQHYS
jgi:hypothetical protein